jgi:hypothetical protein
LGVPVWVIQNYTISTFITDKGDWLVNVDDSGLENAMQRLTGKIQPNSTCTSGTEHPKVRVIIVECVDKLLSGRNVGITVKATELPTFEHGEALNNIQHFAPLAKNQNTVTLLMPKRKNFGKNFLSWCRR